MPATPFVTGPAHIFVKPGDGTAGTFSRSGGADGFKYLGTAERSPKIILDPKYLPLFNDLAGPLIPFDEMYAGEQGFVIADLTRWDHTTYRLVASRPVHKESKPGDIPSGNIGSLMGYEGLSMEVVVLFPFGGIEGYEEMPGGYHFFQCNAYGPEEQDPLGTNPKKQHVLFHAIPRHTGKGDFQLYKFVDNVGAFYPLIN